MNVYFISGLGADRRVFKYIRVPEGFTIHYVEWAAPGKDETLADYALRLTEQIDITQPFILVGLSLGGIMAVEIAKKFAPVATILISSIPVSARMPRYFYLGRSLRLIDILPISFFKRAALMKRVFSPETSDDKELVRQLIRDSDAGFMRWAMRAVLKWKNDYIPQPLWQIHGGRDLIFPVRLAKPNTASPSRLISGAGHLLVMTHAQEVNALLQEVLSLPVQGKSGF